MRIVALIVVVLLSGCLAADDNDETVVTCTPGYNTDTEIVGETGILLVPSLNMHVTFAQIEQFYIETEACLGIVVPGPVVTFYSFQLMGAPAFAGGWGITPEGLSQVSVNTDSPYDRRNCEFDEGTLKHEYVHHLLHASGFSPADNLAHQTPLFGLCGL